MVSVFSRSILVTFLMIVLLCGVYPLLVTGIGKVFFNSQVNGGFVTLQNGKVVGAKLIGQGFSQPKYFHGRPSAAGNGYDAANSSGSNLGPTSQKLKDRIQADIATVLKEDPSLKHGEVPVDRVTGSASGLDPHISPENALTQVQRVAEVRKVSADKIRSLVQEHIEGPQLGFLGEPVVNVLLLNLDLDRLFPTQ